RDTPGRKGADSLISTMYVDGDFAASTSRERRLRPLSGLGTVTRVTSPILTHEISMRTLFRTAVLALVLAACHRSQSTPSAAPAVQVSDANIIAIILAANNTDLSYARLVPARARSTAVKTFAQRMTTDHTILNN